MKVYCIAHVLFEYIYRRSFSAQCDTDTFQLIRPNHRVNTIYKLIPIIDILRRIKNILCAYNFCNGRL